MTNSRYLTSINLDPFLKNAIGFSNNIQSMLDRCENANTGNYPPFNIVEIDEDHYRVELAVAGFKNDELTVEVENGELKVSGFQETVTEEDEDLPDERYIHRGISARSFTRVWTLADHVEVTDASMEDGILKIELEREVPEALQPKRIEIK
jgi:molecular chaperone IbpA